MKTGNLGAASEKTLGTNSKYNSIDGKVDDFHYFTTFIKLDIGRATYGTAQEVRFGDIDRDKSVAWVKNTLEDILDRSKMVCLFIYPLVNKNFV